MQRMPTLFVSHGAPSFAIDGGVAGPQLTALGEKLPRPKAVLVVSPHWMTRELRVSTSLRPPTIHDFGGFDRALYDITYPAPGHTALALRAVEHLRAAGWVTQPDPDRGLDHGAWVPLRHLYPAADMPVFQVSLPARLNAKTAWAMGRALAPLADEEVLIVGSGSLTHNLYELQFDHDHVEGYAIEFAHWIRQAVERGEVEQLQQALDIAPHARRAHPTAEHFLPLLIAAGAASAPHPASVIEGGVTHGVLVMDSYVFGAVDATN